ncbi:hypothetical protein AGMMS49545_20160 [Betaproteobacteria bacterium]|nr:hypothetical protein AGMMS49545_20160 [Betaproteobacteria bacterium]GHU47821.1 hypothetical protein AGMMS50289_23550 [Betaproteobacteria bacterium]
MIVRATLAVYKVNLLSYSVPSDFCLVEKGRLVAQDIFLKISGIEGESQDATHKGEIEVLGWNWKVT